MADDSSTGVYILQSDITESLAAEFIQKGDDNQFQPYFDYADAEIVSLVKIRGETVDSMAKENDGTPTDINLTQYGICAFLYKLFLDKWLKNNVPAGSNNLSNSNAYDKYEKGWRTYKQLMTDYSEKVTPATITDTANDQNDFVSAVELVRG